jgi:Predicted membrane protein (DUF2154).
MNNRNKWERNNLFWGLLCLMIGVLYLIGNIGIFPRINLFTLAIIIISFCLGVSKLIKKDFFIAFIALGVCLNSVSNYWEPWFRFGAGFHFRFSFWEIIVTAALFGLGFEFLFKRNKQRPHSSFFSDNDTTYTNSKANTNNYWSDTQSQTVDGDYYSADYVYASVNFGDARKYVNTPNFKGGDIDCNFGEVEVNLSGAELDEHGAHLRVDGNFCSIKIYVPRHWAINNQLDIGIFSGVNDDRSGYNDSTIPNLLLTGGVDFGDIKILYV